MITTRLDLVGVRLSLLILCFILRFVLVLYSNFEYIQYDSIILLFVCML